MRVIVAIKGQPGAGGASRVTRYIAERDRDPTREGAGTRRLFSAQADDLTYRAADRALTGAWTPQKEELLHLAISFREADYAALGRDEPGRQTAMRGLAREAIRGIEEHLGAARLSWVAGIHRNTRHPHLHLVVHRDYQALADGAPRRLTRLPREILPGRDAGPDGQAYTRPGVIADSFIAALDRAIERTRAAPEHNLVSRTELTLLYPQPLAPEPARDEPARDILYSR